ncbi:MAG: hypothetical protein JXA42_03115 [Anaerolineales bacterium]|nr:hypothetical protein [Anaerolineales bacterium]
MAFFGWTGKILDVDLTTEIISTRDSGRYVPEYLGGRALASRIAWEEIPAGIDAFNPENRIIIATGPFSGTMAPTSGRTIMSAISPRSYPTPWYTHSTLGGWFGPELKYAGYDAIVIHGKAAAPSYLEILDDRIRLVDAADLWGTDTRHTQLVLKEKLGWKTQILAIGPAGEKLVRFATVQHAEENAAGHSGFGAVWGSKNLKAVAVRGSGSVAVADPQALLMEVLSVGTGKTTPPIAAAFEDGELWERDYHPDGIDEPAVVQESVQVEQDVERVPACSQACIFNCIIGGYARNKKGRLIPGFCIGADWRMHPMMDGTKYEGGGVKVPAGITFDNPSEIELHELCNALGVDLWFRIVMQPWFVRCQQLGIHQIRGYSIEPDNLTWFTDFIHQIANREGLGDFFAEDLRRVMDELESEIPDELIQLGRELEFNFGFPAHREGRFWDQEPLPFWVISAMMHVGESRDPTIGSHLSTLLHAEFFLTNNELARRQFSRLSNQVFGFPDAFEPTFENKAPVAVWSQNQHMLIDSMPLCDFAFPQLVRPFENKADWESSEEIMGDLDFGRRLLAAVTGIEYTEQDLTRIAERAFTLERMMLARAGRGRNIEEALAFHFGLPCNSDGTLIDEKGFYRLMDEYYSERGWNLETGWPTSETLQALDLKEAELESDHVQLEKDRL